MTWPLTHCIFPLNWFGTQAGATCSLHHPGPGSVVSVQLEIWCIVSYMRISFLINVFLLLVLRSSRSVFVNYLFFLILVDIVQIAVWAVLVC